MDTTTCVCVFCFFCLFSFCSRTQERVLVAGALVALVAPMPMISALPPLLVTSAMAPLARSAERHAITTWAPASHSIFAVCSPMPVLHPVKHVVDVGGKGRVVSVALAWVAVISLSTLSSVDK